MTTPPTHTTIEQSPPRRPARATIHLAVVAVLATTGLTGCGLFRTVLEVHNETNEELTVLSETDTGASVDWGNITPDNQLTIEEECLLADVIIVDEDDVEVARFPGPFCAEDSPWVITQDMLPDRSG